MIQLRLAGVHVSFDGARVDAASSIAAGARLAHHVELLDTTVGRYTSIGRYTKCHYADIGPFCSISWDVTVGATGHPLDRITTHAFPYRASLGLVAADRELAHPRARLGADVWVGTHAVVMPGVEVGVGAVIGASSVVTRDVAPYTVVAGAPARVTRRRVPETLGDRLLSLAWWDWPPAKVTAAAHVLAAPIDADSIAALEELARRA